MSLTLKIKFNEDVRRITLDKPTKFAELRTVLSGLFRALPENYVLKYVDEEEDLITISSDMELEEAFELARKSPIKILRLNINAESTTAPFVVNQNDVSKLACDAMTGMVNAQGFQTLITSPGFQQLVPQILNSDAFKQQLVPQLLNANNLQQLLPALTNVTPDLNNLFSALMPIIMNAVTANLQHAQQQQQQQQEAAQTQQEQPTQTETPSEKVAEPVTRGTTIPETTESRELLAKEIAAQFEVVEIEKEESTPAQSSPSQEKKQQETKEETSAVTTPTPEQPTPAVDPAPVAPTGPASTPEPAKVPEIPEQLVPAVRALVDMGFTDISRNLDLLEKHNGNLLRVIELCLGEVQD
eukprot:TRINITY_DN194_c0_g1_i1.p1 TRINITY_DN194_c0_g1~~TRINITY_DN194_c0_g1_i1.p1  ORF type:complete len:356 (-),score=105.08 TRINITY_DN194_c0_g1_i1:114-1181(-)